MYPICVILPVYNGIKYLDQAVQSVLQQDYQNFEFIILDDCSTDGSWDYLKNFNDSRITLIRNDKNKGLFYNLNFMISKSNAPIIKLWSQDDVMYPDCIKEVIAFHNKHAEIGFSYSERHYINEDSKLLELGEIDNTPEIISTSLHAKISFITGSIAGNIANVTISKRMLDKAGPFNEAMKISADFEMWVRLAQHHSIGFLKKPLVQLRNHSGQLSGQEKYYIYHLKEDIEAYKILFGYVSPIQKKEGKQILRERKLLFYYTLMVKAFFKGQIKTGFSFLKLLNYFDNFLILSWYFFIYKILKLKVKKYI